MPKTKDKDGQENEMLSVKETAKEMNLSIPRVHQLIADGRLKAQKVGAYYIVQSEDIAKAKEAIKDSGRPNKEKGN